MSVTAHTPVAVVAPEVLAGRWPNIAANVSGVPLALQAFALGIGSDVAAWWAPWALAAAVPYLFGARPGRVGALVIACVALVAGPAPLAGAAAGALAADIATAACGRATRCPRRCWSRSARRCCSPSRSPELAAPPGGHEVAVRGRGVGRVLEVQAGGAEIVD